jgi:hypothetical protein
MNIPPENCVCILRFHDPVIASLIYHPYNIRHCHGMKAFENRLLRTIFGPKRGEIIGGWRKLHHEELHNLYSLPNRIIKSRRLRWTGHVACLEKRNVYRISVGKPEGKDH